MAFLKRIRSSLFLLLEKFKGHTIVVEQKGPRNALGHLVGRNVMGYAISFYCQRVHYVKRYRCPFLRDRHFRLYRVFSTVSSDAPPALIKACELDRTLPSFLPSYLPESEQIRVAVDAYIDLLTERAVYYQSLTKAA